MEIICGQLTGIRCSAEKVGSAIEDEVPINWELERDFGIIVLFSNKDT